MRGLCALVLVLSACGGDDGDGGSPDAGGSADAVAADAALADAPSAAGFGALSGDCDELDTELTSETPARFESAIDFSMPWTEADLVDLTDGGQQVYNDDNAGGSSLLSEVFAFELLGRCEQATLIKTETEIVYDGPSALTDFSTSIDGVVVGVSVTRAFLFPPGTPFTVADARLLLDDKLADILDSSANVSAADAWSKQILVVVAYDQMHADSVRAAYAQVEAAVLADSIVWVLVTNGTDDFLY